MGSMSIVHWAAVLLIVVLVFGTRKLGNIGADLGKAVKGFKDGVKSDEEQSSPDNSALAHVADKGTIDVNVTEKVRHHANF